MLGVFAAATLPMVPDSPSFCKDHAIDSVHLCLEPPLDAETSRVMFAAFQRRAKLGTRRFPLTAVFDTCLLRAFAWHVLVSVGDRRLFGRLR